MPQQLFSFIHRKSSIFWIAFLGLFTLFFSLYPTAEIWFATGGHLAAVPEMNVYTDASYYMSRMREIQDGYPLLGNPSFFEYRTLIGPNPPFADWLASIPLLLGASWLVALAINAGFYSLVTVFLVYYFFRRQQISPWLSCLGAALFFWTSYTFFIRPVSLQIVFPFFLLFCLAAQCWMETAESHKRVSVFLVVTSILGAYSYVFLGEIIILFLALLFLLAWFEKHRIEARSIFFIGLSIGVGLIPLLWFFLLEMRHPFYHETLLRWGLVSTHLPTGSAVRSLVWMVCWSIAWTWPLLTKKSDLLPERYKKMAHFFLLLGLSLLIISWSNILTGKELETAQHIERFVLLWSCLSFIFFCWFIIPRLNQLFQPWKRAAVLLVILIGCWPIFSSASATNNLFSRSIIFRRIAGERQTNRAEKALAWLEQEETEPRVIFTPEDYPMTAYVPVVTKHYVLFDNPGTMHFLSDQEAEERYLLSKTFVPLTQRTIEDEYRLFASLAAIHPAQTQNRLVKICRLLPFRHLGFSCGTIQTGADFRGHAYFAALLVRYQTEILPHVATLLKKYHVAYIIITKNGPAALPPSLAPQTRIVYQDAFYQIYAFD